MPASDFQLSGTAEDALTPRGAKVGSNLDRNIVRFLFLPRSIICLGRLGMASPDIHMQKLEGYDKGAASVASPYSASVNATIPTKTPPAVSVSTNNPINHTLPAGLPNSSNSVTYEVRWAPVGTGEGSTDPCGTTTRRESGMIVVEFLRTDRVYLVRGGSIPKRIY